MRPCDSVYLIPLRTYLVKHTHTISPQNAAIILFPNPPCNSPPTLLIWKRSVLGTTNKLRKSDYAPGGFLSIGKMYVFCICGNQSAGAVRPFDNKDRTLRKVVFPSDLDDIILVMQTVKIHMHYHKLRRRMLRDDAESRACHCPLCAKSRTQTLSERGLSRSQIPFQANNITRLQGGGEKLRHLPSFYFAVCFMNHRRLNRTKDRSSGMRGSPRLWDRRTRRKAPSSEDGIRSARARCA